MSDNFDIGPLTWVKDDINQSLDSVLESMEVLHENARDTSGLRFSQTHLYQASGALDMVGLEGCKLFCSYLEKLIVKLEQKELEATPQIIDDFTQALKTLKHYIQELLNGAEDLPLRLFPALQPIALAMDEQISESALFFPDTSSNVPKNIPSQEFSEEAYLNFIAQQRRQYQKSLLSLMQGKEGNAVDSMVEALSNVTSAQHKTNVKTLWWTASAFAETLAGPTGSDNIAAKRMCRKLDQELRQLANGESKSNPDLLRELLYFVASSNVEKDNILKVKEVFSLKNLSDRQADTFSSAILSNESELELIEELKREIAALHEVWQEVSNKINFEQVDAKNAQALVDLDNVLITKFANMLDAKQAAVQSLTQPAVAGLFKALSEVSVALRDNESKSTQLSLIEVAGTLHLLNGALTHYQSLDTDAIQQMLSAAERLRAVATGENQEILEDARIGGIDRETIAAVVKDIQASLKVIEQSLDTYFRNPEDKTTLSLAPTPLKQMAAIFDMLSLPTPMEVVRACHHYVEYFQGDDYKESQADFELVAESLSMIGLYANEMPNARPDTTAALEAAVERLNNALSATGKVFADVDLEALEPVEFVTEKEQQKTENVESLIAPSDITGDKILDKALDDELADIYLTEAEGVLAQIAQNLQALRVNETEHEPLVEIRRSYHTLKGSGRTVGLVGQAEVAAEVEKFLNALLDKQQILNPAQISKLEEITAAFASWAAALRANNEVEVDQAYWLAQVASLSQEETVIQEGKSSDAVPEAYVLIGGKRKLNRQFYEIFLNESMQNLSILEQDVAKLAEKTTNAPDANAKRAVHTLASNALAAGFKPMGELGRALENWLDTVADHWSGDYLELYTNATHAVAKMWQAVSELKTPRATRALIKLLDSASEQVNQNKEHSEIIDAVLYEATDAKASTVDISAEKIAGKDTSEEGDNDELLAEHEAVMPDLSDSVTNKEVNPELLALFAQEANELLPEIGIELRAWKAKPKAKQHAETLQRALHTLKGSARMAAQADIGDIAHGLEEYILGIKTPAEKDFDAMFIELDKMSSFFDVKADSEGPDEIKQVATTPAAVDDDVQHVGRATGRKSQSLRMRAEVLDRLINEAGEVSIIRSRIDREMLDFKNSSHDLTDSLIRLRNYLRELEIEAETQMQSRMNILQESDESFDPLEFDRFTRLQELTRMIAESVNDVGTIQSSLLDNLDNTEAALQQQNRMNRQLQQGLLGVRMLPFQQISERMQRIVRQTARELKKSVDLVIKGEATEVDRSVLDRVGAPLEHLLRNAVAHGIETKAARKSSGKPEKGTIEIDVRIINDEIHIVVSDDGAGVDLEKVRKKAIQNNLLDANTEVTEDSLLSVIFEPGFSTSAGVSQIAGRGVGLDVVRNDISGLGGRIDMATETGKGATFNIFLPVTQSVAQVLVVRNGDDVYALPVAMIEQAQKIKRDDLLTAYADGKVVWNDVDYPFHHFAKLLDHQEHQIEDAPYASVLLLRSGAHTVALHVDEVIGNQEIVMKDIGPQLARVPGIVGATVTGDGRIVLIMNPVQIANREVLSVGSVAVKNVKTKTKKSSKKAHVLVVDDSLTMRKVLSRLLEREGYEVEVAKDGMDAMELLQIRTPDIILTDIEMPRMDGFGLSRNIRDDERTVNTPLIMISSRTADKHQDLAKEIGVDAFFGKPVHDDELLAKMKALLKKKK